MLTRLAGSVVAAVVLFAVPLAAQPCTPFADSFESGDLSLWDDNVGVVTVNTIGVPDGTYRMSAFSPGGQARSGHPNGDREYSARFWVDRGSIAVNPVGDFFRILTASGGAARLRYSSNGDVLLVAHLDSATLATSPPIPMPAGGLWVRFGWRAATADGANDGFVKYMFEGSVPVELTGLDTDTILADGVELGVSSATAGAAHFDAYQGRCDLSLLWIFVSGFESGDTAGWELSPP